MSFTSSSRTRPLLLGHRGARPIRRLGVPVQRLPAENTLAAFNYAMANGCDGFELDVRYTLDRRHVLCHDPEHEGKHIAEHEYAGLDRRRGYNLPCLEEVLSRFAAKAYLDIELKVAGNEEAVVSALRVNPPQSGYVVSSFLPEVLLKLHELDPSLSLGYICKNAEAARHWSELPICTFVPHHSLLSRRLVDEVHARELQLLTWTVNRKRDLLRLAEWGVDGLISDDPKLLSELFPTALAASAGD
jgi:glycerophosphoryl diester phosphodiesterase